jgi:outer membrane protein
MANSNSWSKTIIPLSIIVLLLAGLVFFIYHSRQRIAYVRTNELIVGFNGMKEARVAYKAQSDVWQANVDTLRMQYQRCVSDYQTNYKSLSDKEKEEKQAFIKKLETNLDNYTSVIRKEAADKEKEMSEGVLNQVNSYIEEYAKKKGYAFIIGGANGNLLYGDKSYDITDELLTELNKDYKLLPPPASKSDAASQNIALPSSTGK